MTDAEIEAKRDDLRRELAALTATAEEASAARSQWQADHMKDFADFEIGEEVFDAGNGHPLGVVSAYRINWEPIFKDSRMGIAYEIVFPNGPTLLEPIRLSRPYIISRAERDRRFGSR